jgi:hypothetical protein
MQVKQAPIDWSTLSRALARGTSLHWPSDHGAPFCTEVERLPMKDDLHFLRVARSITTSRGARTIALPLVTAAISLGCGSSSGGSSTYCGNVMGVTPQGYHCTPTTGAGGGSTTGTGGSTGHSASASHSSSAGAGGAATSSTSAGGGGGPVGVMVMPDGGLDAH